MDEQRTIPAQKAALIIGGIVLLVVVVAVVLSGGDDDSGPPSVAPSTTVADEGPNATTTTVADGFASGIPPVDCNLLLDDEMALDALESDETGSAFGAFGFSQGEVCRHTVDGFDDHYVQISPGPTADFLAGARVLGVEGVFVPDVGDAALWFGGPDADGGGDVGILSVARETPDGGFYFRIELGRPGLDPDDQLAIAVDLARYALARFPGAAEPSPEPEVVEPAEPEAPDRSTWSYRDHVEAGVERGDWDWGEGVITTLEYILGDRDDVPGAPDGVAEASVGGFVDWVRASLDDEAGPDRATIESLLDRLFPVDQLAYLSADPATLPAGGVPGAAGTDDGDDDEVALGPARPPSGLLGRSVPAPAQGGQTVPDCGDAPVWHDVACVATYDLAEAADVPEGKYVILAPPQDQLPALGVTEELLNLVWATALEAVTTYELVGDMPRVTIALSPFAGNIEVFAEYTDNGPQAGCDIVVWAQGTNVDAATAQWLAFEMARCLTYKSLPESARRGVASRWFAPAVFYYLSDVVVPEGGLEDGFVTNLRAEELSTSVALRRHANTMFLLSLHAALDPPGVFDLVRSAPRTTTAAVDSFLGSRDGMDEEFHTFARTTTDDELTDSAGTSLGGGPFASEQVLVEGPMSYTANLNPMMVSRLDLVVEPGKWACVTTMETDGEAIWSWRPGSTTSSGPWTQGAPEVIEDQSILLATATGTGGVTFSVDDVVDDPNDCDEDRAQPEPFEFDFDCPGFCGDTDYLKEWFGDMIDALRAATGAGSDD